MTTADSEQGGLEYWRHRILSAVLWALAGLGLAAYVPSVTLAIAADYWSIAIGDTVAYAWLLYLALRRSLPVRTRALQLVVLCVLLATLLLVVVGPNGAGLYWLGAATTMASLLLGARAAIFGLVTAAVVIAGIGVGIWADAFPWISAFSHPGGLWLVLGANALFLDTAVALSVAALLRGLEASVMRRLAAEERLREAQKLEAIGTLAGGIAHELNNMLVPILADAEALASGPDAREEAARITRAALRARDLVRRILVFGRRDAPERAPLDAQRILSDAIELLRAGLPANITLELELDAHGTIVRAHESELHQIVMNLGTNAIQAMPEGGTLRVVVGRNAEGTRLCIRVIDTGVGMDEATREHAIDPFFTTKAPGVGTGLGLSAVHGIALGLGGGVSLTSTLGVGTEVVVELAITDAPLAAASMVSMPSMPAMTGDGELLLLVDDEPAVLEAHARMLVRCGYRVLRAEAPARALELLAEHDDVRVLITDLNMPQMDGVELVERARATVPGMPAMLVTGYLEDADAARAERLGAVEVLLKPFGRAQLAGAVVKALGGASRPTPEA